MKHISKCSAFVSLSYQVHIHVKACNPIPLIFMFDTAVTVPINFHVCHCSC